MWWKNLNSSKQFNPSGMFNLSRNISQMLRLLLSSHEHGQEFFQAEASGQLPDQQSLSAGLLCDCLVGLAPVVYRASSADAPKLVNIETCSFCLKHPSRPLILVLALILGFWPSACVLAADFGFWSSICILVLGFSPNNWAAAYALVPYTSWYK